MPEATTARDVTAAVRWLVEAHETVAGGGPWVRMAPGAVAEAAAGGRRAGPLDGHIVAVKDLLAVAGLPLGAGSRARADAPPEPDDAPVVAALRRAGAVVAGTVGLHELAFGVTGVNDQVGFARHPTDPDRIPGGSSSGSAVAVALDQCSLAVGTDTGGSVRIPAALCGVVGFKPARGTYPLDGVLPLAPTLDHVGLLARRVQTIAAAHGGLMDRPVGVESQRPKRIGVDRAALGAASEPVHGVVEGALRALGEAGCELVELRWPDVVDPVTVMQVSTTILFAEAAATHADLMGTPAFDLLGPDVHARLETGAAIADDDLQAAYAARIAIEDAVRATLDTVDVVAGPTVPIVAPTIDQARADPSLPQALVANTRLANVTGVPALSLPLPGPSGLPVGLQLLAASNEQALSHGLRVAAALGLSPS